MVTEKQLANLKPPINERPPEEQLAIRQKAQKGMIKSRKEKKQVRECLELLRDMPMPKEKCIEMGVSEGTTYAMGMALAMVGGTLDKNPAMAKLTLEALDELKNELNINGSMPVVIHDDIK